MVGPNEFNALGRLLRPLRQELSLELANALVHLKPDNKLQSRYDELADRNTSGKLTSVEHAELESLARANSLLGALKIEARAALTTKGRAS